MGRVNGRTDQWWRNIIGGNVPDSFWKKNFRMSKDSFHELAAELVPYIAAKPASPNYRTELIRISFIYQGKCKTNSFVLLGLLTVKIYTAKLHSTFIILKCHQQVIDFVAIVPFKSLFTTFI